MTSTPRCTTRSCPVRYRGGPDRPCPVHAEDGDTVAGRMAGMLEVMAAPGERMADADGHQDDGSPPDDEPITLSAYLAQRPSGHP